MRNPYTQIKKIGQNKIASKNEQFRYNKLSKSEQKRYDASRRQGLSKSESFYNAENKPSVLEPDDKPFVVKEEISGDKPLYHVMYANETKMESFDSFKDAQAFKKKISRQ